MEPQEMITHLLDHYIARDIFRHYAYRLLQRAGMDSTPSHLNTRDMDRTTGELLIAMPVVSNTMASLERCKPSTLEHLHDLLHREPVLDEHEHEHVGEDVVRFVIEEESGL